MLRIAFMVLYGLFEDHQELLGGSVIKVAARNKQITPSVYKLNKNVIYDLTTKKVQCPI